MNGIRMDIPVRYRTVRGWSGRKYLVRMTESEINARRILGLIGCILVGVPIWILIMAIAAGVVL